jgi:hypothetical protein
MGLFHELERIADFQPIAKFLMRRLSFGKGGAADDRIRHGWLPYHRLPVEFHWSVQW